MTITPEELAKLAAAATPGRRVQFHPSYCPEAEGTPFSEWDSIHDMSVILPDGTRYKLAHYRHADDAALSQAAHDMATLIARQDEALKAADALAKDLGDLIAESEGVYGLHRNGDPSPWSELLEGGRFEEWLRSLAAFTAARKKLK